MDSCARWCGTEQDAMLSVAGMHASGSKARTDLLEENNVNEYHICDGLTEPARGGLGTK